MTNVRSHTSTGPAASGNGMGVKIITPDDRSPATTMVA